MCWELAKAKVAFEPRNPITSLMSDVASGTLREDILDEKVCRQSSKSRSRSQRVEEVYSDSLGSGRATRHGGHSRRGYAVRGRRQRNGSRSHS